MLTAPPTGASSSTLPQSSSTTHRSQGQQKTHWARLIALCGVALSSGGANAVALPRRSLRFSYALPQDGKSYCNTLQTPTETPQQDCVYLHRTPNADSFSASGSSCFTYAESYREISVLDFDAGDRPMLRSLYLRPEYNHNTYTSSVPMGGILPDGTLSQNMVQDYCQQLTADKDSARYQGDPKQPTRLPESTAYKACTQGKDFFWRGWFSSYAAGGMVEDRHGKRGGVRPAWYSRLNARHTKLYHHKGPENWRRNNPLHRCSLQQYRICRTGSCHSQRWQAANKCHIKDLGERLCSRRERPNTARHILPTLRG